MVDPQQSTPTERWSPATAVVPEGLTLPRLLYERVTTSPDSTFAEVKAADGRFSAITAGQLGRDVLALARGLIAAGVQPGERVAIMGPTSYEWTVADFAALCAGAVVVPVYETSSASQVRWIVEDAEVVLAVTRTADMAALFEPLIGAGTLRRVLVIDDGDVAAAEAEAEHVGVDEVQRRAWDATPDSLATIVYTSGTTGRAKGVMLSHGNIVAHAIHGADDEHLSVVVRGTDKRLLLFLPLSHVFARFIVVVALYAECVIGYSPDMSTLVDDLGEFRPTWLLAVPRVFETVYNRAQITAGTGLRGRLFDAAAQTAIEYSKALDTAVGPSRWLRMRHRAAHVLVLHRITDLLGGQIRYAVSGSAALNTRLAHFFGGLGITVMEGYGLTEVAAPTTVGLPGLVKIGTVGAPYPGTGIRIAADGEVLVKGPNVFQGYLHDQERTAESMTADGWYRTGDLGDLDEDGYLRITGRIKDVIVTAGGKNVQPEPIENAIRTCALVSEVVAVGEGRPFVAALISLDEELVDAWLAAREESGSMREGQYLHPAVKAELQRAIDEANRTLSRAESVRAFRVTDRPFLRGNGEVSSSQKPRRAKILGNFAEQIDQMYEEERQAKARREA